MLSVSYSVITGSHRLHAINYTAVISERQSAYICRPSNGDIYNLIAFGNDLFAIFNERRISLKKSSR